MAELSFDVRSQGLLERSGELAALDAALLAAADGHGRVVLVYGEAGIGKSALVRQFCEDAPPDTRVLWGQCEALFTPRPLGPLLDIAHTLGGALARAIEADGKPYEVAVALERELAGGAPTILVLEDIHLADEATLDVLRLVGRSVGRLNAMIVGTYREDAVGRWHPLRLVLGEVAASTSIDRVRLPRLSSDAVDVMATAHGSISGGLYRATGGNPFFVTEVLASGDERIPETVRDAVLGRAARLTPAGRRLVDAIAVARPQGELWLLEALAPDDIDALEETIASGIVTPDVAIRHELARIALEESIVPTRRAMLHRRALELLADPPDRPADPARLAHHADAVDSASVVLDFAPRAAARASRVGAHREAATHYARALRFAAQASPEVRAGLFAGRAGETFLIADFDAAAADQREALRCYEQLGDRSAQGTALCFLAQVLWQSGHLSEGLDAVSQALGLLEESPGSELVIGYCVMSCLRLAAEDPEDAMSWARRAEELAGRLGDDAGRAAARRAIGWVEYVAGSEDGLRKLVESVDTASSGGHDLAATESCVMITRTAGRRREYDVAERYLDAGLEHCRLGDYDVYRYYLLAWRSRLLFARGDWTAAEQVAQICLADPCPFARVHALISLGGIRARRGDSDVWEPLDEALSLAVARHELQWISPVAVARAEAAWLEGRPADAIAETDAAYAEGAAGTWWEAGLAYWRWRAGAGGAVPRDGEEPYRLEMAGDPAGARDRWLALGSPYEAALALVGVDTDDETSLRTAHGEFQLLGASPAMRLATGRLREIGARGVPRGPQTTTRANPANLTRRELEVLELVTHGLRNADIAERLVVADRTVDHHVSAILRKLDVSSRAEATFEAARRGIFAAQK